MTISGCFWRNRLSSTVTWDFHAGVLIWEMHGNWGKICLRFHWSCLFSPPEHIQQCMMGKHTQASWSTFEKLSSNEPVLLLLHPIYEWLISCLWGWPCRSYRQSLAVTKKKKKGNCYTLINNGGCNVDAAMWPVQNWTRFPQYKKNKEVFSLLIS